MDKFLPGIHLLSTKARRALGVMLLGLFVLVAAVPIIALTANDTACGGSYPDKWCKPALDTVVDDWGMYNRQCVSYTAFKVAESGRRMPFGFGDASKWPEAARAQGIAVDSKPRVGDVAIIPEGQYGHSMYVEAVHADGALTVSQYNRGGKGTFSRERVEPSAQMVFIHF